MSWWEPGATAIVVPVPEAEAVLGALRRVHSPSGRDAMIAHVTLLSPTRAWRGDAAAVCEIATAFAAFAFRLARFGRFPSALYLRPEPAEPFAAVADALRAVVPAEPMPGGTMIPHLTIASRVADDDVLDELEAHVSPLLPIEATATEVVVYERGDDLGLRVRDSFALGR